MNDPVPFGKYLLLERVNVGGMAEVFKAKAFGIEGFERFVAVKRILPNIAEDGDFITMFVDEAKIAVQLTHACIAQIFDLGKVGDSYFIAMEYVQGKDLRTVFERARQRGETVPVAMACYAIMRICEGLDYAHNKKDASGRSLHLVHRDVSPQNILASYDGELKLVDFGIAKAANKASKTRAGIIKGKFGYMSPEQVRGLEVDRRSDVFALGICLYELLTGRRLFIGSSDFSTVEKVRKAEVAPPTNYNSEIADELEDIILKALAKDPASRYQTAMELHDELQSFMYTSGNFFSRKDLSDFMAREFREEIAQERARDQEYQKVKLPVGLEAPPSREESGYQEPAIEEEVSAISDFEETSAPNPQPQKLSVPASPARLERNAEAFSGTAWDEDEVETYIYDPPNGAPQVDGGYSELPRGAPAEGWNPASAPPHGQAVGHAPIPESAAPSEAFSGGYGALMSPQAPALSGGYGPLSAQHAAVSGGYGVGGPPAPSGAHPPAPIDTGGHSRQQGMPSPFDDPKRRSEVTAVTPRHGGADGRRYPVAALAAAAGFIVVAVFASAIFASMGSDDPGIIHLRTTPSEVVAELDTEQIPGTSSPYIIQNVDSSRKHLLVVRKPGYGTWAMPVEVKAGETLELDVDLEPKGERASTAGVGRTGFTLDTDPSGASVLIDGHRVTQRTPVEITDLKPGTHTVQVVLGSSYDSWQTQINVKQGEMLELPRAVLNLRAVRVLFRSEPPGAEVTLVRDRERRAVGTTPTEAQLELAGDPWIVEITRPGHEPWSRALNLSANEEEIEINAYLEHSGDRYAAASERRAPAPSRRASRPRARSGPAPSASAESGAPGTLRINTRPWSKVYVDGRLIGNTPQMGISLSAGSHQLTLVNPEFGINHSVEVRIRSGETTTEILNLTPSG